MKRVKLTILFATYYFFMPFIWLNCSSAPDVDYVVSSDSSNTEAVASESDSVDDCQSNEFLTASCVDVIQEEEDRVSSEESEVSTAEDSITDFQDCYTYEESTTDSTEDEEADSETVDSCVETVATMTSAYGTCSSLSDDEKYSGCEEVEDEVNAAIDLCDTDDESVSQDFCGLLDS